MNNLWNQMIKALRPQMSDESFEHLFHQVNFQSEKKNEIVLEFSDPFQCDWLQNQYGTILKELAHEIKGNDIDIKFITSNHPLKKELIVGLKRKRNSHLSQKIKEKQNQSHLNPQYTFKNFVVGPGNRFAAAAAQGICKEAIYNPLFLYGGVGLGKTHLMQAIGNYLISKKSNLKVLYLSAEQFTTEYINGLLKKNLNTFKKKFRTVDFLLLDDIQFLIGKDQSREEFFNTFNQLYQTKKQIIISSDRPPSQFKSFDNRLITRLNSGLTVDIKPPALETRLAILEKKSEVCKIKLSKKVLEYIAESVTANVRLLEGAFMKALAYTSLTGKNVDINACSELIKDYLTNHTPLHLNIEQIQREICKFYSISFSDLIGNRRYASIVRARQIAIYLCREFTNASFPLIAKEFNGKNHSTMIYACKKIKKEISRNPAYQLEIETIVENLSKICSI